LERGAQLSKVRLQPAVTSVEGEQFVHKELWLAVERQMEHAKANSTGRFYDNLVAMVFAFLSLEAYLNFVGDRLDPNYWRDERKHFAKTGFRGKLEKVLTLAGVPYQSGRRPFTTVHQLNALRDLIAHGKTLPINKRVRHAIGRGPSLDYAPLTELVTDQRAAIAVEDIRDLAQRIHQRAMGTMGHINWWGDRAFGGITLHTERSTTTDAET
jgi:hypothetical protein